MFSMHQCSFIQRLAFSTFLLLTASALAGGPLTQGAETSAPASTWLGADGNPLPFHSDEELLQFLRTANVLQQKEIATGITRPLKLTLEKDGVRAHAIFRSVNEDKPSMSFATGRTEVMFRDSYLFEPAAYQLSLLLGLNNVPPVTLRSLHGVDGSIQIWVEQAMTEEARVKKNLQPPDAELWRKQTHLLTIFDALVLNTDRTQNNLLITPDWKLWFIDHTRAFRRSTKLPERKITACDRALYERLQALPESTVREQLRPYLRRDEITSLLKRRDAIVSRLRGLIAEKGESAVLFTLNP